MITAEEALQRLREGNARFAAGDLQHCRLLSTPIRRKALIHGQSPFAVILGCSDSRVPAEIVFDQGLGDLFVIRVAGNIAASSQIGSVEFAVEHFGTPLAVVLGHSRCGAVLAAIEAARHPETPISPHLGMIVDRIKPSVQMLLSPERPEDHDRLWERAVRENIRATASHLQEQSSILAQRIAEDNVMIVGAEYHFETGRVDFLTA